LPKCRIELAGAQQAQAVRKADGRMRKHHQVREGQIVRVIDGPFSGFRGEVKEVDEQTAKVAVQAFGRVTPMDLALGQIELVPESLNEGQSLEYEIVSNRLGLTQQQLNVLKLMMQEKSNEEICHELGLSEPTVKNLIAAILKALKKFGRG
jgi:DNA-binding CsgD family transcriptional regulator